MLQSNFSKFWVLVVIAILCTAGLTTKQRVYYEPPPVIIQVDSLTEWQIFIMSLIEIECERNPKARLKDAIGPFQITPIYVEEINRLYNTKYVHEDAWDLDKSLQMFEMMNDYYNPKRSIDDAIKLHNPIADSRYSKKIKKRMELIRFNEQVRASVIDLYAEY